MDESYQVILCIDESEMIEDIELKKGQCIFIPERIGRSIKNSYELLKLDLDNCIKSDCIYI